MEGLMWVGPFVGGLIVGVFANMWWKDQTSRWEAQRIPSPWLRHKATGALYRLDGRGDVRDGDRFSMVLLYDCQKHESELWPESEVETVMRSIKHPDDA